MDKQDLVSMVMFACAAGLFMLSRGDAGMSCLVGGWVIQALKKRKEDEESEEKNVGNIHR